MNIFEIINKKEYEDLAVINDGKKLYTIKQLKRLINPIIKRLTADKIKNVLIVSKSHFDFVVNFLAAVFSQKNIILFTDSKKIHSLKTDYILLDKTESEEIYEISDETIYSEPDYANTFVTLFTSGSTGIPKAIRKNFLNLFAETNDLIFEIKNNFLKQDSRLQIVTSATAYHMYGFIYWFFIVLCDCKNFILNTDEIIYPDRAELKDSIFISTPSFLEEYKKYDVAIDNPPHLIFTAGDKLKKEVQEYFKQFNTKIIEIYGSTETGTIAYRYQNDYYQCFKNVEISTDETSQIIIKSPYFIEKELTLCDTVQILNSREFYLGQRTDKIVKIQEKRVNTEEIENILEDTDLIDSSYCFKHRDKLACAAVLNNNGKSLYTDKQNGGRQAVIKYLKNFIKDKSEVVPQKWKFLYEIPRTQRGKIDKNKIENFFNTNISLPLVLNHNRSDNTAEYELIFSKNCNFFDGHFKDYPVLPGVIQLYFAHAFAAEAFKRNVFESPVKKIKFSHIIKPDEKIKLKLYLNGKNIHYGYEYNDIIYSSGVFEAEEL